MIGLSADEKPVYRPCEIIGGSCATLVDCVVGCSLFLETVIVKSYELAKKKTNIGLCKQSTQL